MNSDKKPYLTCKDYTVSLKNFDLVFNNELEMLETYPQPNIDQLGSYYESTSYISHTDAKETLTDKIYQSVKKIALKNKLKLVNSFKTVDKNILDIGCGTGDFLMTCKNNGWNVVGVEPNKNAKKITEGKIDASIYVDINEITETRFDVITLWHVLEHVPNLSTYISTLKKLLKPSGVLIVAVPNFKSFDACYYKQYWAAFDVPRHLWHFSKKSIKLLFSKSEMIVEKVLPMKFDSFYVSLLSEKNKTGKSNFFKAFSIGLISNIKAMQSKEYSSLIYVIKNR
jgi:2-polyprenyl-3-methyl-5-hydroxy-6-metoxy-1,4-benzoquinol methylase